MFFMTKFNQNLFLSAIYLNTTTKKRLTLSLLSTVEGMQIGIFGLIIIVIKLNRYWKKGKILPGSSFFCYNISYKAITFKVFKGEILDSVLTKTTHLGFFCEIGLLSIFVSKKFIPDNYEYNKSSKCFQTQNKNKIENDMTIRIRIIGIRYDSKYFQALGSIKESYLGKKDVVHEI